MGLNIHADPIGDVSQVFGGERPALAVNLVGDGLRDAFDPRLSRLM